MGTENKAVKALTTARLSTVRMHEPPQMG
jgi:hypothetical protein